MSSQYLILSPAAAEIMSLKQQLVVGYNELYLLLVQLEALNSA